MRAPTFTDSNPGDGDLNREHGRHFARERDRSTPPVSPSNWSDGARRLHTPGVLRRSNKPPLLSLLPEDNPSFSGAVIRRSGGTARDTDTPQSTQKKPVRKTVSDPLSALRALNTNTPKMRRRVEYRSSFHDPRMSTPTSFADANRTRDLLKKRSAPSLINQVSTFCGADLHSSDDDETLVRQKYSCFLEPRLTFGRI